MHYCINALLKNNNEIMQYYIINNDIALIMHYCALLQLPGCNLFILFSPKATNILIISTHKCPKILLMPDKSYLHTLSKANNLFDMQHLVQKHNRTLLKIVMKLGTRKPKTRVGITWPR